MVAWASFYADWYVNETASENWIKNNAMKGPASYSLLDGEYSLGLLQPAHVVSDAADSELCPKKRFKVRISAVFIGFLANVAKGSRSNAVELLASEFCRSFAASLTEMALTTKQGG